MSARQQGQVKPESTPEREAYYAAIDKLGVAPLWNQYGRLLSVEPQVEADPFVWHYDEVRGPLIDSSRLISAKEAERRVLMLENPSYRGKSRATETLFTGLQLIMPGEVAPAHRHSPNALRLVLEGEGAYTSVNGEKTFMHYGDFIITPSWAWHDHGHEGTEPVIWQDILDLPLVHSLATSFYERYPEDVFPEGPPAGDSLRRYGATLKPVGYHNPEQYSPIFHHPFAKSREAMEELAKSSEIDPYFGLKMEFIDPTTGAATMATISAFLQRLPGGFKTERYQSTEGAIFTCLEGGGRAIVGDEEETVELEFGPRDIFVIPGWHPYRIEAEADTYLFAGTDRILQEKLGFFRERRGNQ